MFQALRLCVLELTKDDEVWEKRETNIYVQMKPAEKSKRGHVVCVCVRACTPIACAYVNKRACVFGVAAQQLV